MNRAQRIQRTVKILQDAWETADDLGLFDNLVAWWKSRPAFKRRQKRRQRRRARRKED